VKRQVVYDGGGAFYLLADPEDDVREGDLVRWTGPRRVEYAFVVRNKVEDGRWRLDELS
jgi:hypothetical protein